MCIKWFQAGQQFCCNCLINNTDACVKIGQLLTENVLLLRILKNGVKYITQTTKDVKSICPFIFTVSCYLFKTPVKYV